MAIGLGHYLTVAAILFTLGVFGIFLNRKNVIIILMSIELMLLAVNINLVAFSAFLRDLVGQIFALFVLTVAAAEAAIGLAILVVLLPQPRHHRGRRHQHDEGLIGCRRSSSSCPADRRLIAGLGKGGHRPGAGGAGGLTSWLCCCLRLASCRPGCGSPSSVGWHGGETETYTLFCTGSTAARFDVGLGVPPRYADRRDAGGGQPSSRSLVHLYSIGYMSHDPHQPRFFAYLSLFTFAMLMLVTSDNLLQMFFGWEGVGVASYLLIGFWYKQGHRPMPRRSRPSSSTAWAISALRWASSRLLLFGSGRVRRRSSPPRRSWPRPSPSSGPMERGQPHLLPSCCSSARWASRRSSSCTPGCRTRWRARRRSPR